MNFMLYIPKFHRIESEIHPNFPKIRPIRLGPNFFFQNESQNLDSDMHGNAMFGTLNFLLVEVDRLIFLMLVYC
jgi:hypothetical protein